MKKERTRAFRRRLFTLYGLLLVLIVALVSAIVATEVNNRAEYFADDSSATVDTSSSERVLTELPDEDSFDVYFYVSKFFEAEKIDGETSAGTLEFKVAIYNKTTKKEIKNLNVTLNVGTNWAYGHDVFSANTSKATVASVTEAANLSNDDYSTLSISNFDEIFPTRQFLVIKIKAPTAKLKIEWDEVSEATGIVKSYEKIYTYSYDDYFIDKLSIGGLSEYNN